MRRSAAVAGAGAALLLAAFTFDSATLFVPAAAFLVLPGLSVAWIWLAARSARIQRTLEADRVIEEQPVEARLRLTAGWLGLPGAQISDALSGGSIALSVPPHARRIDLRVLARFPNRGRVILRCPSLRLRDQLGLAERVRPGSGAAQELLVLPRTERISWRQNAARALTDSNGGALSPEPTGAVEPEGLRQYRPGTPASRIHWPALARGAGLLERRLLADGESSPLVVLDARSPSSSSLLDAAVRAVASLTLELAGREGCDLLLPGERRPLHVGRDLAAWPGAHVRLALVEGGPDCPVPALLTRQRLGTIFYVTAQPLGRAPVSASEGRGEVVLVLPDGLSAGIRQSAAFEVCGCTGFLVRAAGRRRGARLAA